jgi:hypothetical protein
MSDGRSTYEPPVVHAMDGEEGAELLAEVQATCHNVYCPIGTDYNSGPIGSSCVPPSAFVHCNSSSAYCSVQYTF